MLKIKEKRKEFGMNQTDLAKILNTTTSNISGWENNKWQPDIENLKKLSNLFKCSIDYLVDNEREDGTIITTTNLTEEENNYVEMLRQLSRKDFNILYDLTEIMLKANKHTI